MFASVNEGPSYHLIEQRNRIAGMDQARLHDACIKSAHGPAGRGGVACMNLRVVNCFLNSCSVDVELVAGASDFCQFNDRLAYAPALAGAPFGAVDSDRCDIFAEGAGIYGEALRGQFGDCF